MKIWWPSVSEPIKISNLWRPYGVWGGIGRLCLFISRLRLMWVIGDDAFPIVGIEGVASAFSNAAVWPCSGNSKAYPNPWVGLAMYSLQRPWRCFSIWPNYFWWVAEKGWAFSAIDDWQLFKRHGIHHRGQKSRLIQFLNIALVAA